MLSFLNAVQLLLVDLLQAQSFLVVEALLQVAKRLLHLGLRVEKVVSLSRPALQIVDLVVQFFLFDRIRLVDLSNLRLVVFLHLLIVLL